VLIIQFIGKQKQEREWKVFILIEELLACNILAFIKDAVRPWRDRMPLTETRNTRCVFYFCIIFQF